MNGPGPSPLENALAEMQEGRLESDAFFALWRRTEIFVPTPPPGEAGDHEFVTQDNEPFDTIILEVDGKPTLPMFETFERLQAWAADAQEPIGYMEIEAGVLMDSMDPGLSIVLFAGDEAVQVFDPVAQSDPDAPDLEMEEGLPGFEPDAMVSAGPPDSVPEGLIETLLPVLRARDGDVRDAWLIMLSMHGKPETARLTLALRLREDSTDLFHEVATEIAALVTRFLPADDYVEFMNLTGDPFADDLAQSIPPFFSWSA